MDIKGIITLIIVVVIIIAAIFFIGFFQKQERKQWHLAEKSKMRNGICMGVSLLVYITNKQILIKNTTGIIRYFCQCYLNDLVCPLFFLGFCQYILRWLGHEIHSYKNCLFLGMSAGIFWEYITPLINTRSVSDPYDLLCYFVVITVYFLIMKIQKNARV